MPRLQNKGYTARAPAGAGSWPEIPDIDPQLSEIDGGKTNAALQRWNDLVRARLGGNEQQNNGRFKNIQTAITRSDGYLESVWTMQAIAGQVVTGMTLFSSTGPEPSQTVSRISFQADVFQINTASGNKQIFSATATEVKLGDVLTVDLVNAKLFIGVGNWADADTAFYVDEDGFFSLKDKLYWNSLTDELVVEGTIIADDGSIGGFEIGANYVRDVADSFGLASVVTGGDDVRFWAGNTFANRATASFRVYESGIVYALAAVISGTGTAGDFVAITSGGFAVGSNIATGIIRISNNGSDPYLSLQYNSSTYGSWVIGNAYSALQLSDNGGNSITLDPRSGAAAVSLVGGGGFSGGGSLLTSLNADNISSGTVGTARLGSGAASGSTWLRGDQTWAGIAAGNVSGLAASATTDTTNASNIGSGTLPNARLSFTKVPTADVAIDGHVVVGGVKLATVA